MFASACGNKQPPTEARSEVRTTEVAALNNELGLEFLRDTTNPSDNAVLGPPSLLVALAMARLGAQGETAEQMDAALHLDELEGDLHQELGQMLSSWNEEREYVPRALVIANRVFGNESSEFRKPYLNELARTYAAPLELMDFTEHPDKSVETINKWVADQTMDRITGLLPPGVVDGTTQMLLVNAMYFKADWTRRFMVTETQPGSFYSSKKKQFEVQYMRQTERLGYAKVDGVQILRLGYQHVPAAMYFVLPKGKSALEQVERRLTARRLERWLSKVEPALIEVKLPRFRIAPPTIDMAETLKARMPLPFDAKRADFSKMAILGPDDYPFYIQGVHHKAFIAVNEVGTEAAAATAVSVMQNQSAGPQPVAKFIADHPFLFFLRDERTGTVLFLGRVTEPEGA